MNKQRRKKLEQAIEIIAGAMMEEEEALNNLPEGIRESGKADKMEEYIGYMDSAKEELEQITMDE
jgi:hypothetical protein